MRIRKGLAAVALSAALVARGAAADELGRVELAARTGFVLPLGLLYQVHHLSDDVYGFIPLRLEAGYRPSPSVMIGVYGSAALGLVRNCGTVESCSAQDFIVGVQLHYHFAPRGSPDPWVGLGIGHEWLRTSVTSSSNPQALTLTYRGLLPLELQTGVDFSSGGGWALGPYLSVAAGQYGDFQTLGDIANKGHVLVSFGVRGSLGL